MKKENLKIRCVIPTMDFKYYISFDNGNKRELDVNKLIIDRKEFNVLKEPNIFYFAQVDRFHKNITFTEDLSLSIEEIFKYSRCFNLKKENAKIMKTIYAFSKQQRRKNKITQKDVADMIDVPQSAVARIESGSLDVQLSTLLNYLSPLGLSLCLCNKNVPNKVTLDAMCEMDDDKTFSNIDELKADLGV